MCLPRKAWQRKSVLLGPQRKPRTSAGRPESGTQEEGICKAWKQEAAEVQKERVLERKKDSYPAMIHLPTCPEPSLMSTQDCCSAGCSSVCPGDGESKGVEDNNEL